MIGHRLLAVVAAAGACSARNSGPKPATTVAPVPEDAALDAPAAAPHLAETWVGALVTPRDPLDIVVHFTRPSEQEPWTATLDVPRANVTAHPLTEVALSDTAIAFVIDKPAMPQANEIYRLVRSGDQATGYVAIGAERYFVKLVQQAADKPPEVAIKRPQTPQPPFPYSSRELTIASPENGSLAATLTIPQGKPPFAAVILISGSGQQDRDSTIFGHKPFLLLADKLTRRGIAVLRYDDRGVGGSTGAPRALTTEIADAHAAFDRLATQSEIDGQRIGLLGHSLGGVIAPSVASRGRVAFIVALAAPGIPGHEVALLQVEGELKRRNAPEAVVNAALAAQRAVGKAIVAGDKRAIERALRDEAIEVAKAAGMPPPSAAAIDAAVAAKLAQTDSPWVIEYFKTDPAPLWRTFRGPVLALWGTKDTQVAADVNRRPIARALAANQDATLVVRDGLNHLFQPAMTGALDEYGAIEQTFDEATLALIVDWVVAKTHTRAP